MRNVVRMELRRLFMGKALFVCMAILILIPIIELTSVKILMTQGTFDAASVTKFQAYTVKEMSFYLWRQLFHGGALFIIVSLIVTFILTEDYTNGTMKYSLMAVRRSQLSAGKHVSILIVNGMLILAGFTSAFLVSLVERGWSMSIGSFLDMFGIMILAWFAISAFTGILGIIQLHLSNIAASVAAGLGLYVVAWMIAQIIPDALLNYYFLGGIIHMHELTGTDLFMALLIPLGYVVLTIAISYQKLKHKAFLM